MVCFVRAQMLGRIVLQSTLALSFHIALVFLRVSAALLQGAYSHTKKRMRDQRMRQKIATRASSVFASSSSQGAAVERACAAACMQAKFGCSESANEQSSRAQGGSEPGRRGTSRAMTADQVGSEPGRRGTSRAMTADQVHNKKMCNRGRFSKQKWNKKNAFIFSPADKVEVV